MRFSVDAAARLDKIVAEKAGLSRREAQRLIDEGKVRLDGKRAKKGELAHEGALVEVELLARAPVPQPELPLTILYCDDAVIAVDKPPGIPTHPLRPGETGTLANALAARHPECGAASEDPREGGVAHRLDGETSGVVLAARTREAWRALRRAFTEGQVDKEYWALVAGDPPARGEVDVPLKQVGKLVKPISELVKPLVGDGLEAHTTFEVIARGREAALVRARAATGRMHQIRAHLALAGHPLVGDLLYGGPPSEHPHVLHAASIEFPHPDGGRRVRVTARLPAESVKVITELVDWSED